ncbi:hypothetical protein BH23PSE1_BH23PSE1_14130 [soil metagenome]
MKGTLLKNFRIILMIGGAIMLKSIVRIPLLRAL